MDAGWQRRILWGCHKRRREAQAVGLVGFDLDLLLGVLRSQFFGRLVALGVDADHLARLDIKLDGQEYFIPIYERIGTDALGVVPAQV